MEGDVPGHELCLSNWRSYLLKRARVSLMGSVIQVEPRPESYVNEWRAARVDRADMAGISSLLRPIGVSVFADLADPEGGIVLSLRPGHSLHARQGDWVTLSPHDKIRVLDPESFEIEFTRS